ncbi:MAG: hypothetical protein ACYDH0_07935 [Candidatus Aminicenantales bacterium]
MSIRALILILVLIVAAPAQAGPSPQERDIEIPVTDVRAIEGEVLIDIAYETRIAEVIETLELDLARLVKKAAEKFPDSRIIHLAISNRGEKICELEIPTEAAAQGASNNVTDEAMLSRMTGKPLIDFRERLASELRRNEWPRFSKGTFTDELASSVTADEWKTLDESPIEGAEETAEGGAEPESGSDGENAPGGKAQGGPVSARLSWMGIVILGAIILIGLILVVARIVRKRGAD